MHETGAVHRGQRAADVATDGIRLERRRPSRTTSRASRHGRTRCTAHPPAVDRRRAPGPRYVADVGERAALVEQRSLRVVLDMRRRS